MRTEILNPDRGVPRAVELLRAGEVVALPTETVYGLAADALNSEAAAKIFEAKERPLFDPLIVHLPEPGWANELARIESPLVRDLMNEFWPGPLTLVLPKREIVPDIVTGDLDTVAMRVSAHPVLQQILLAYRRPLAAPSANRFGRLSPTRARDVEDELGGRIPLIVDGGQTSHGLESTIVRVEEGEIEILRIGPVTEEQLAKHGRTRAREDSDNINAPGQLKSHYAPKTKVILIDQGYHFSPGRMQKVGRLYFQGEAPSDNDQAIRFLSRHGDLREAATNLFRSLRELDQQGLDIIVAERVPNEGIGRAINDRLQRAAEPAN